MIKVMMRYKEQLQCEKDVVVEVDADSANSYGGALVLYRVKEEAETHEQIASFAPGEWIYWEKI